MASLSGITASSTHLSGNPIMVTVNGGGPPAKSSAYQLLLKVVSADGELLGGPFIDAKIPPASNSETFNISGLVDQQVQKTFSWPLVGFGNPHSKMVYDIWLYAGERYIDEDGELVENFEGAATLIFVVKGKLPEWKLSELNAASKTWHSYYCVGDRFLTFMPRTQTVSPWQPVKLFYKTATTGAKTGTITGTFSDGSTQVVTQSFTAYADIIIEFDIMPEHMGFPIRTIEKRLEKYTFTVGGETFTFHLDWNYHENYYYLIVDNQLGGMDCIWLRGRLKYAPIGERTTAVKPRATGSGPKIASLQTTGTRRQRRWITNTGFASGELITLDTLLDSPNTWLLKPPATGSVGWLNVNYEVIPVIIQNTELELYDELADGMENQDIEILEAH